MRGADDLPVSIFASQSGFKKFVLEEKIIRGLATDPSVIENYPGFPEGVTELDFINNVWIESRPIL